MLNESVLALGKKRSTIRELFEYGAARAAVVGRENIFDFSIGNPSVPAPAAVRDAILEIVETENPVTIHGYTSAQGDAGVRRTIAEDLNTRFGTTYTEQNLYMTVGAAAALSVMLKALVCDSSDEVVIFAPYFPEYKVFIEQGAGAKCVICSARPADFQIDFDAFEALLTEHTRAVIVNSPNNPSGVVYSDETLDRLAALLQQKSAEYGHKIYLISDEPYRELLYGGKQISFIAKHYIDTIVCYSYSKSLSLPGERIGYVLVPNNEEKDDLYAAVCGAGRVLGYVNAPSLFQRVAARCTSKTADLAVYEANRNLLYESLLRMGYSCVKPDGAFYLFPQTLEADDRAFCERAKRHDLLVVPGADFGAPGHMRISYCVPTEMLRRAIAVFEALAKEYGVENVQLSK